MNIKFHKAIYSKKTYKSLKSILSNDYNLAEKYNMYGNVHPTNLAVRLYELCSKSGFRYVIGSMLPSLKDNTYSTEDITIYGYKVESDVYMLAPFAVKLEYRNADVLSKLMQYIYNDAIKKDCNIVQIGLYDHNKPAISFFIKNGFKEVHKSLGYENKKATVYQKRIRSIFS